MLFRSVVGPFTWIPEVVGHECVLASVDADGDPSNADTVAGSIPHRHLVPFDNNIGQRNLVPVASSPLGLVASFEERRFTARNPFPTAAEVDFDVTMPAFLEQRGWELQFANPGGKRFTLGARESRGIVLRMKPGSDFSKADVRSDPAGGLIEVVARAKDIVVGGMTYRVDPRLEAPPRERSEEGSCNGGPGGEREQLCERLAERLTKCLELPDSDVSHVKISGVSLDIRFDQDC